MIRSATAPADRIMKHGVEAANRIMKHIVAVKVARSDLRSIWTTMGLKAGDHESHNRRAGTNKHLNRAG
jgi:hypothetical protein